VIKRLRTKHHYSQEQLAQMSGLSLRTIQRVESGQSASLETLKSLAAVFEVDVDTLKGDITVIDKKSEEWALAPAWVKLGFWGIRDRRVAMWFEIFSLVCGLIGTGAALFYPAAAGAPVFFLVAYLYAVQIRWVDNKGLWS
jgi:transcriptional regulator with XRE-family HTH domain